MLSQSIWATLTKEPDWVAYKQQFISYGSGVWKPETEVPAWLSESSQVSDISVYPDVAKWVRSLWSLCYKGTHPIHEGSTLMI